MVIENLSTTTDEIFPYRYRGMNQEEAILAVYSIGTLTFIIVASLVRIIIVLL